MDGLLMPPNVERFEEPPLPSDYDSTKSADLETPAATRCFFASHWSIQTSLSLETAKANHCLILAATWAYSPDQILPSLLWGSAHPSPFLRVVRFACFHQSPEGHIPCSGN